MTLVQFFCSVDDSPYDQIIDAIRFQSICHGLGHEDGQRDGHDVVQCGCELRHDHYQRDGGASDTCQGRCGSDKGVDTGHDSFPVWQYIIWRCD